MMTRWWRGPRGNLARLGLPGAFVRERHCVVAIIVALMMIPLIVAAGGAIDVARLYVAKTRLIFALDSAALAAGAAFDNANPTVGQEAFDNYFNANYPAAKAAKLGTVTPSPPVPTITSGQVDVTATVTVNTVFLKLITIDTLSATVRSVVNRQTTGLELALVLDNSSSIVGTPLADLKSAVGTLLDTVFQGDPMPPSIFVGIVPYAAAVNIGSGNAAWAQADPGNLYPVDDGLDPADPIVDTSWKGCVMARPAPYDTTDDFFSGDPSQGEWRRYFWEAEHFYYTNGNEGTAFQQCTNRWWRRLDGVVPVLPRQSGLYSDPSFFDGFGVNEGSFRTAGGAALTRVVPDASGDTTGPNKACPTPITPLTNVRADLDTAVSAMEGWRGGGTMINQGAVWGWRVLSPGEPFGTYSDGITNVSAYNDPLVNKALVIMTDGRNSIERLSQPACYTAFGPNFNPRYSSDLTPYGFLSEGSLGTTNLNTAVAELDTRTAAVCSNIKAQGITIYTIVFNMDGNPIWDGIKTLMRNCATSPTNFFDAPSAAALTSTFAAIGAQISKLRVAR